jgi:outer membrane protein OmpA-like peptidoglycan-associated protein
MNRSSQGRFHLGFKLPSSLRASLQCMAVILLGSITQQAYANGAVGKVIGYTGTGDATNLVAIDAGRDDGVVSGEIFRVIRSPRGGVATPIETGLIKVTSVFATESLAEILTQSTPESVAVLAPFQDIMAGDLIKTQRITIAKAKVLTPEIVLRYSSIFDDPKGQPSTYELTIAGRRAIRDVAEQISWARAGMLVIEGHTDQKGSSEQNQIESYQRALTIRQMMIDDLGFDESRVTAIGLGESEPISDVILPGNADRSRRLVFKVVPMPGKN